ncbi:MAG: DUF2252 domain-containing protein, partial [Mycobacteriales bacterium]
MSEAGVRLGRPEPPAVLDSGGRGFASVRESGMPREERYALGRGMRTRVPRSALADWTAPAARRDPVEQVVEAHTGRLERLVPVRIGRMAASP